MEQLLVKNIGTLIVDKHCKELCCGEDMKQLDYLNSAWLLIENGRVKDFGTCQRLQPWLHSFWRHEVRRVACMH